MLYITFVMRGIKFSKSWTVFPSSMSHFSLSVAPGLLADPVGWTQGPGPPLTFWALSIFSSFLFLALLHSAYYFFNILLFFIIQIQKFSASICSAYHFSTNTNWKEIFAFGVNVKNERKRTSRMWENACLSIKIPKVSRALKWALDPSCR